MSAPCQRSHQGRVLCLQMVAVQAGLMQGPRTCMIHACEGPTVHPHKHNEHNKHTILTWLCSSERLLATVQASSGGEGQRGAWNCWSAGF